MLTPGSFEDNVDDGDDDGDGYEEVGRKFQSCPFTSRCMYPKEAAVDPANTHGRVAAWPTL